MARVCGDDVARDIVFSLEEASKIVSIILDALKNPLTNVRPDCNLISSLPWAEPVLCGGQAYCLTSVLRI